MKIDCRTCGACCVSPHDQDVFCDVTEADMDRLGPYLTRKYVLGPDTVTMLLQVIDGYSGHIHDYCALATRPRRQKAGPFRGWEVCACVFLRGSIMNRVSCRIYDRRPKVCREAVKPGTRFCKEIRSWFLERIEDEREQRG